MKATLFKSLVILTIACIGMVFSGCSLSDPSASDAQRVFENKIRNEAQGRIRLVSFQKTNGQKRQMFGENVYHLEFQAEIEFTQNCKWVKNADNTLSLRTTPPPSNALFDTDIGPVVQAGQRQIINGSFDFEKTEQGWRAAQ